VARLLFIVTGTFTIPGHGITLIPVGDERFRVGDTLRLRRPDGSEEFGPLGGIEMLKPVTGPCQAVVLLTGRDKDGVPPGTEVWSVDRA
jgi:hypothetical protein